MKYCPNCGAKMEADDAKFCQECGINVLEFDGTEPAPENVEKVITPEGVKTEQSEESKTKAETQTKHTLSGNGNNNKKSLYILAGAVSVLVVVLIMFINHKPSVNLNDYISADYSGYNTVATVQCTLDTDALKTAIDEKGRISEDEWYSFCEAIDYLQEKLVPSQRFDLSNGDKVTITIEDKKAVLAMIEKYGVKVKTKDITLKIKNLPEVRHIQLTNDLVDISLSGYEEVPTILSRVKKIELSDLIYSDKNNELDDSDISEIYDFLVENVTVQSENDRESLVNGKNATFKISTYAPETFACDLGIIFESSEYEMEVKGLTPLKEIDLAELIQVNIEGVIPNLYLNSECDYYNDASYIITDWTPESGPFNGSNGDTISVEIGYDSELADEKGYKVINTHKEITVENLDSYEVDCSDLTTSQWQELIKVRQKGVTDYYLDNSELVDIVNREFSDNGYKVLWRYFNVQPYEVAVNYYESENASGNIVSMVFAVQTAVLRKDDTIGEHTFYHVVNMRDLFKKDDGTLAESEEYYDDGREGKYYSLEELDKLSGEIEDNIKYYDEGAEVQYFVTMYSDYEAQTVPERVNETETEENALLEVKEETKIAPELDPEAEAMASAMIEYDGHKYYRFDMAMSWIEAENFCQKYGYHLASVGNEKERKILWALLTDAVGVPQYSNYWVGARCKNNAWSWSDESDFYDDLWSNGSPANASDECPVAYIYLSDYPYLYNADNMSENVGFIMEVYDKDELEENIDYLETCRVSEGKNVRITSTDSYTGSHYAATIINDNDNRFAEYDLNGKYSEFTGTLYTSDGSESDVSMNITFWGDGKLLYHQPDMNRQSMDIVFNVDVTGVQKLTIVMQNVASGYGEIILDKGKLYKAESEVNNCNYVQLADMVPVDGQNYDICNTEMWRDNKGYWHNGYISITAEQNGFVVWNLNKQYSSADITCAIPNRGGADTSITVNVYGDNKLLDSKEMLNKTSDAYVFPADIDLSDVNLLKIEVINENDEYDTYGFLVDSRLYLK